MEKLLARLAQQLDAIDEASLMSLWSKYATLTSRFEPTQAWERAALIFSLIQGKRWKNQLFNYYWAEQRVPAGKMASNPTMTGPAADFTLEPRQEETPSESRRCHVLEFHLPETAPRDTDN